MTSKMLKFFKIFNLYRFVGYGTRIDFKDD